MGENETNIDPIEGLEGQPAGSQEPVAPRPSFGERLASIFSRRRDQRPADEVVEGVIVEGTEETPNPSETSSTPPRSPNLSFDDWSSGPRRTGKQLLSSGAWIYVLVAVLVVAALVLPPISLPRRLGLVGYTRLNAETLSLSHPDGITISIDPTAEASPRVRLDSVPQAEFLAGEGNSNLVTALGALPGWLAVKSPYYIVDVASRDKGPATIEVLIPNEAEPWETLDLYAWTGEDWEWLGGTLDSQREMLVARVDALPESVVVMQTMPVFPAIGTVTESDLDERTAAVLTEAMLPGLFLGTDGMLLGEPAAFSNTAVEKVLLVRNWQEEQSPNLGLLSDVLGNAEIREAHIQAIVGQVESQGASAVAVNYLGVGAEQRESFTTLVTELATALHSNSVWIEVLVPEPTESEGQWYTAGYDWHALGAVVDSLVLPLPDDPAAYVAGGQVDRMLQWATGQVNRYKLRTVVTSLSINSGPAGIQVVSLEEALEPFGEIASPAETTLAPGQEIQFTLAGNVTSIMADESAGTYVINYQVEEGSSGAVWLGTPSFLARKLDWAFRYHLGGVVVTDLASEGNMPGMVEAVDGYRNAAGLPQPTELQVSWAVTAPDASTSEEIVSLSQPDFSWVAPEAPGQYTVAAAIAQIDRGSIQLTVAEPTPEPTPEPEGITAEEAACLSASFVADVTIPDGTQLDPGEEFVKTWRVRNSGTCDWPEGTALVLVSSQMGGPDTVEVGAVAAGDSVDISVNLAAPAEDGNYNAQWKLRVGDLDIPNGIVTVVIQSGAGAAAAAGAPAVAAAPIAAGSFELGGHVLNSSLLYANQMHYAGMNWAKVQVRYSGGASDWIQAAHANNFRIQLSALGSPDMVIQPGFTESYAAWVASLAAAGADAIEIWNEPNIDREWQIGHISPAAYTQLLCAAYNAIKAANPNTIVISAAPAPTGYFGGCGPNGCDDVPFLQGMYNAGAAACMDYIGAHHNAGATSPSARAGHPANPASMHHSWFFLPQTEAYWGIFGGTRQLFYTEMGYVTPEGTCSNGLPGNFSWGSGTTLLQQAAWLSEAVQLSINTGMVRSVIVWNIDFNRNDCGDCNPGERDCDPQASYAIVRPGGACPTCDALHAILGTR